MHTVRFLARLRAHSARRPWLVWLGTAVASLALVAIVHRPVADAAATRARWGATRSVLVATHAVPAGTPVAEAHLVARSLPVGALPEHALTEAAADAVVVRPLDRGEIVVEADLGRGDPRFALVPAGHVVVAVPRPAAMVPARPGDRVSITPPSSPTFSAGNGDTSGDAIDAVVVDLTPAIVLVAVTPADAGAVAAALGASDPFAFVLRSGPATVGSP